MKEYDFEEEFHAKDRKQFKKERKKAQSTDRSKYKKTDLEKRTSKEEDSFSHLSKGKVIAITKDGYVVDLEGKSYFCSLKGNLKKERREEKNLVAVGDWVRFSFDQKEGSIFFIEQRRSSLSRTDISGKKEQLIAVNVDQALIAVSVAEPKLKPALIDRYLIAAEKGNICPVIVINKIDLLEENPKEKQLYEDFLLAYEPLGLIILSVSVKNRLGIEALQAIFQNKTSVISGQSGVGKSSLLNLCFGLSLKTGDLATKTQKGAHTTSTAELLPLPGGGYCIDTPGIRSFGIWKLKKEDVQFHFQDLLEFASDCKYPNCSHINEPSCAVLKALEEKTISSIRYDSYKTLFEAVENETKQTWS